MRRLLLSFFLVAGCAGSGTVGYHGTVNADVYGPDLVYVSPGVQVIADYNEPIFYADNYYWRYDSGRWYRSNYYTGGWTYASAPYAVRRIERPYAYVRYRPSGYVARRQYRDNRPAYRDNRPVYRDHRNYRSNDAPTPYYRSEQRRGQPAPVVRDHRTTRPAPVQDRARVRDADRRDDVRVRDHRR